MAEVITLPLCAGGTPEPERESDPFEPLAAALIQAKELKKVAHTQSNALHDVMALLGALEARLEQLPDDADDPDPLIRLVRMAGERLNASIAAFNEFI